MRNGVKRRGKRNEPNGAAAWRIRRPSKTLTTTAKTVSELGHSFSLITHTHLPVRLCTDRDGGKIKVIGIGKVEKSRLPPRQRSPVPRRAPLCVLLPRPGGDRVHTTARARGGYNVSRQIRLKRTKRQHSRAPATIQRIRGHRGRPPLPYQRGIGWSPWSTPLPWQQRASRYCLV